MKIKLLLGCGTMLLVKTVLYVLKDHTWSLNKVMRLAAYRTIWQHCGLALHLKWLVNVS